MAPMKLKFSAFGLVMLSVANWAAAQTPAAPPDQPQPMNRRMFIDPSATTVSFGKASLIVNPLTRKGKLYVGDYQLNVVPYFFMSEKGALELEASDDTMHKLLAGIAAEFTGKATNNKNGKPKIVTGKAIPSSNDRGSVTFSVETDNGPMVFNTSYHFAE